MVAQRLLGVLVATALASVVARDAGRAAPAAPRFEPAPCPFAADGTVLKHVRCGYVPVPENRTIPDGRRLKLSVAILKSLSSNPRPDPVVVLAGGPGEHFVSRAPGLIAGGSMDVLRADRDIILFDQRGVGFSEPAFCPELANQWIGGADSPAERRAKQQDVAARCGESMRGAGYDLSQYNSVVSAHDLQDLRRALGYKLWNLHGRSYGTRLALAAMRVAPEGIRSVVLDSPSPPNRAKWFNMPGDFSDVLKRLSAACASQPECQTAFPDVEPTFWRTVDSLRREPLARQVTRSDGVTRTATMTAPRFAGAIHAALERLQTAVPMLVHAVHARDEDVLNEVTRALTRTAQGRSGASPGMAHTVTCFEEAPLATSELRQRARNSYPPVLTDEGVFAGPDGCDALHPHRATPEQLAAVKSAIPTLIFTGEFDLQTHRSNGPLVAASLKNSQLVEIPGVAHVQSFRHECTRAMMRDFHDAPGRKVDVSCLKSIPPLRFVTDVKQLAPPPPPQAPSFENAPCPFTADANVMAQVRCGYVSVPENRAAPQGRRLKLAVAVMKSLSSSPRPDPVVVVGGGPGDRMVDRVPGYVTNRTMDAVRAERDVVVYDQRGVGHSEPAFCVDASAEMAARRGEGTRAYRDVQRQQLARCGEHMRSAGYDLSQYNSIASAHDLADLRRALGYEQWNLRAASYGTRLAQVAMRVAPQGIRSAVFDGPVPTDRAGWFNKPADFVDVLTRLSVACAAQPSCNDAFPDVERTFWRAVEEHERAPKTWSMTAPNGTPATVAVDGAAIAASVVALIERGMHQAVPLTIHAVASGNQPVLTRMRQLLAQGNVGPAGRRTGLGLHYAVNCFEEAPLNTVELLQKIRKAYSPVLTDQGVFPDPTLCKGLHAFRAVPADLQAVASTIPTLIFTGEFDLVTHKSNGEAVARSLKSRQLAEIPGAGHVQSWRHECTRTMMRDFYNAPGQKVDASCLKSIPPLRFLTDMMGIAK